MTTQTHPVGLATRPQTSDRAAILNARRGAGIVLFVLAAEFMTAIMLAASMAPGYDISGGAISDRRAAEHRDDMAGRRRLLRKRTPGAFGAADDQRVPSRCHCAFFVATTVMRSLRFFLRATLPSRDRRRIL